MTTKVSTGEASLAFRLLSKLAEAHSATNLLISPTSLVNALTLAYNGAAGKTAKEMAEALGLTGLSLDQINQARLALTKALETADPSVQLISANSLWLKNGIKLKPTFSTQAKKYFRSQVTNLDFADPRSVSVINKWVAEQTKEKIKSIINSLDPSDLLVLTNAVYFKGAWTKPFQVQSTEENGEFKLASGSRMKIAMMQQSGHYLHTKDAKVEAIQLPYGNGQFAMYILLPSERSDFHTFLTGLTFNDFDKIVEKLQAGIGTIKMPRFTMSDENELSNDLKSLGMATAFDPNSADFQDMATVPKSFFIGQVLHKTIMNVNEAGTEAAAVTAIVMATAAYMPGKPFEMNVDRPFVVAIREEDTKEILFLGAVLSPEKLPAPKEVNQSGR